MECAAAHSIVKTHFKKKWVFNGGDEEDRTLDLTDANRTLSQLSYAPVYIFVFFSLNRPQNTLYYESEKNSTVFCQFEKIFSRFIRVDRSENTELCKNNKIN